MEECDFLSYWNLEFRRVNTLSKLSLFSLFLLRRRADEVQEGVVF